MKIESFESETLRIIGTGDTLIPEESVRFRLLYSGQLLGASRSDTRSSHKHAIRSALTPQLKRLWATNAALKRELYALGCEDAAEDSVHTEEELITAGMAKLTREARINGGIFVPLATENHCVKCKLDILFLRPDSFPLIKSGDIDNRMKTLFDALRCPQAGEGAFDGEEHFVLLSDDSLISEVSVVADQLLLLPGDTQIGPNDVFIVIDVQFQPLHSGSSLFQ